MNIPLRLVTPELDEQDRIADQFPEFAEQERIRRKEQNARVVKAFTTAREEITDRFGKPRVLTAEEKAAVEAREREMAVARADAAVMGRVWDLLAEEGEKL
jgi:hypothetical protein